MTLQCTLLQYREMHVCLILAAYSGSHQADFRRYANSSYYNEARRIHQKCKCMHISRLISPLCRIDFWADFCLISEWASI